MSHLESVLSRLALGILIGNVHSTVVEYLLEQRKIRPMPSTEEIAQVRAVPSYTITLYIVPRSKWSSMNP
jgi:hypothetical protein